MVSYTVKDSHCDREFISQEGTVTFNQITRKKRILFLDEINFRNFLTKFQMKIFFNSKIIRY